MAKGRYFSALGSHIFERLNESLYNSTLHFQIRLPDAEFIKIAFEPFEPYEITYGLPSNWPNQCGVDNSLLSRHTQGNPGSSDHWSIRYPGAYASGLSSSELSGVRRPRANSDRKWCVWHAVWVDCSICYHQAWHNLFLLAAVYRETKADSAKWEIMVRIDPNQNLLLSQKSWPLALQLVDTAGTPVGIAHYTQYVDHYLDGSTNWLERNIYYSFQDKRLCLIVKNST